MKKFEMKWFKDYEELLRMRYVRLYGERESRPLIRQEKRDLILKVVLVAVLVCLIIVNDVMTHRDMYSNVRFNKNGEITGVVRPDSGEENYSFSTKVKIISDSGEKEKEYYITIEPAGDAEEQTEEEQIFSERTEEETADAELKSLISNLNEDTSEEIVVLPKSLENGSRLVWTVDDGTDPVMYIAGMAVIIWLMYRSRFSKVKAAERKARESIVRELPEYINRLVLLLNAGIVLNTAFLKIAEDTSEKRKRQSYFYGRMAGIAHLVNETNASFHQELYMFAKYSGVKELMRITNIMMDNISKGDDLADKLRRENEILWFARKQQAEEKGRLAETKMTMPLMIMLMVLIMVSIAPALMEI